MKVFFYNMIGDPLFPMEVDSSDTVLEMKQKIEKRTGYSVSEQFIFLDAKDRLKGKDNLTLQECGIVQGSRFNFFHPDSNNNYQVRFHQTQKSSAEKTTNSQDSSLNKNQAFQRGQNINDQEVDQPQPKQVAYVPYFPARLGISYEDYVQAAQAQPEEVGNIPDFPERISKKPLQTLQIWVSLRQDTSEFAVYVKDSDNVGELRREVVKIQGVNLPEEYIFLHEDKVLDENKSFRTNGVAFDDSIEIFPQQLI